MRPQHHELASQIVQDNSVIDEGVQLTEEKQPK